MKKEFNITIEETVSETFSISATSLDEAMDIAQDQYREGILVLCPGTLESTQMMGEDSTTGESTSWIEV